mmetsp:Transcript_28013/g.39384  ORF Transcript_28013/g.39384 Transcript_28013/m.39384 type:complete len:300 (+) Transcript_28013:120-1019(+)
MIHNRRFSALPAVLLFAHASAFQVNPAISRRSSGNTLAVFSTATDDDTTATLIPTSEAHTLFAALGDSELFLDPSKGTCCRSSCSGCQFMLEDGAFRYDEYLAPDGVDAMWLAPYAVSTAKPEPVTSKWASILIGITDKVKRDDFEGLVQEACKSVSKKTLLIDDETTIEAQDNIPSKNAIDALWNVLSPVPGSPELSSTDIARGIRGIDGGDSSRGGAVSCVAFEKALQEAGAKLAQGGDEEAFVDYEAMDKDQLKEIVNERGMVRVPGMKKLMIEELRFFDANGRQGKRHPTKHTLS